MVTVTDATFDALVLRAQRPVPPGVHRVLVPAVPHDRAGAPGGRGGAAGRLVVAQLDVDAHPPHGPRRRRRGMPTLSLYVGGAVVAQLVGAKPKAALLRAIEEHLPVRSTG